MAEDRPRPTWSRENSADLRRLGQRIRTMRDAMGLERQLHDPDLQRLRSRYLRLANKLVAAMGGKPQTPDERAAELAKPAWPGAPLSTRQLLGPPSHA